MQLWFEQYYVIFVQIHCWWLLFLHVINILRNSTLSLSESGESNYQKLVLRGSEIMYRVYNRSCKQLQNQINQNSAFQVKKVLQPSCAWNSCGFWNSCTSTSGLNDTELDRGRPAAIVEPCRAEEYDLTFLKIDGGFSRRIEVELALAMDDLS